jgi:hypothetical protein
MTKLEREIALSIARTRVVQEMADDILDQDAWLDGTPIDLTQELTLEFNTCDIAGHIQGSTPLDGYWICKICGTNLKKVCDLRSRAW